MYAFERWIRFNLVGAVGMVVQLSCLALFNHYVPGHYLLATAVAIEITLLHNFVWHTRFTWRDRGAGGRLRQCVRFHLSVGIVSMFGNLALTRLLVRELHPPVVVANFVAIVCCSLANYWLGNRWAFRAPTTRLDGSTVERETCCVCASPRGGLRVASVDASVRYEEM
jgi:putative flippase GtrA